MTAATPTDLTFERFSECEAYVVSGLNGSFWEVAIFNYAKENFSAKDDSGSCIFNAEGKVITFLHSCMPRGMSSHVTYGMPAYFVLDQNKTRCLYADFSHASTCQRKRKSTIFVSLPPLPPSPH